MYVKIKKTKKTDQEKVVAVREHATSCKEGGTNRLEAEKSKDTEVDLLCRSTKTIFVDRHSVATPQILLQTSTEDEEINTSRTQSWNSQTSLDDVSVKDDLIKHEALDSEPGNPSDVLQSKRLETLPLLREGLRKYIVTLAASSKPMAMEEEAEQSGHQAGKESKENNRMRACAEECRSTTSAIVDRHPSEPCEVTLEEPGEHSKEVRYYYGSNDEEDGEERVWNILRNAYAQYHRLPPESNEYVFHPYIQHFALTREAAKEGAKVRKMGAQPCTEVAKEIPLPASIGMYDKLIENLKTDMLCSEESRVETPDFIKDIYKILDESEKSATLRAIRLSTRYDEINTDLGNLNCFLDSEDKLAAYEKSIRLFDVSSLESGLNIDEFLEEISNSKAVIKSETENTLFYEVKGDKVDYFIDPPKPAFDFVFSPDAFYSHMHQTHLDEFKVELKTVALAYDYCLFAILWNFVCLVACLFACTDRRRTKGALAQPFDSCD